MGGSINRTGPIGIEDIKANPTIMEVFERAGWLGFLERFHDSDTQLAMEFTEAFDGSKATVQQLRVTVSEESISQVTGLS
jgi:hypothetical protein